MAEIIVAISTCDTMNILLMYKKFFRGITKFFSKTIRKQNHGYLLPVILSLGLATTIIAIFGLGVISNNTIETNNRFYQELATEAANSGIVAANSCLAASGNILWGGELNPSSSCVDTNSGGYVVNDTARKITTTFTVTAVYVNNGKSTLTSKGTASLNGVVMATVYVSSIVTAKSSPPTFTSISPNNGGTGILSTITGTNFVSGNTTVTIGGVAALTTFNSTTSLTVTIPTIDTSGAKDVVITTPGGTATAVSAFNYYLTPTFTNISAASGGAGTVATITGDYFVSGNTKVTIGDKEALTTVNSTTSLTVTIPTIDTTGPKDITITTPGGSVLKTGAFYYYLAPTFTSISPNNGGTGILSTITGTNFVSGNTTVTIGGVAALTTFNSTTSLTVTIPTIDTSGAKDVVITTPGGTATGIGAFAYTAANKVIATIAVGTSPRQLLMNADGSRVYVLNNSSKSVSIIDTSTNTVVGTVTVQNVLNMAIKPDGSKAYVTSCTNPGCVYVINTITNTLEATVTVGANPGALAVTPDGSKVYVANYGSANVSIIDTSTNTVVGTVAVGSNPNAVGVTPNGTRVYVPLFYNNVPVLDTNTKLVTATVTGSGSLAKGIAFTPDGTRAYVSYRSSNWVNVINTSTNTVIATVPVGGSPESIVVTPNGTRAYVFGTSTTQKNISVIDTATNTVTTVVRAYLPTSIVFTPDSTKAYVANYNLGASTVDVMDTSTNTVTATVAVGSAPWSLVMNPNGTRVYVANANSNTVSVISI